MNRTLSHTHRRLIDEMRHFELCFEFTDRPGHYLIPRHLHDNELDIPWDDSDALKFQYHYETLPDSVTSRFIVRMNQFLKLMIESYRRLPLLGKGESNNLLER